MNSSILFMAPMKKMILSCDIPMVTRLHRKMGEKTERRKGTLSEWTVCVSAQDGSELGVSASYILKHTTGLKVGKASLLCTLLHMDCKYILLIYSCIYGRYILTRAKFDKLKSLDILGAASVPLGIFSTE